MDSDDCIGGGGGGGPGDPPPPCTGGSSCTSGCDGNGNGVPDAQECGTPCYAGGAPNCDSDNDGIPDNHDCDSGGSSSCCSDSDGDGASDQNEDGDCDGIPNGLDCDSPCFQGDPSACADDDGDGIRNQDDLDSPLYEDVPAHRGTVVSRDEPEECCDCEAFRITGPAYIGVYGSALFGVDQVEEPPLVGCQAEVVSWTLASGQELVSSSDLGTGSVSSITALCTAGTVSLEARIRVNGRDCRKTHSASIVQYHPITVRYTAFIPCDAVEVTLFGFNPPFVYDYFGGDNRSYAATSPRYRVCQQFTFRVSDAWAAPTPPPPAQLVPPFGVTLGYNASAVTPGTPPCGNVVGEPSESATLAFDPSISHYSITQGTNAVRVIVKLDVNGATNPLAPPFSPGIDTHIELSLDQRVRPDTGTQYLVGSINGSHDRYPAHEIYIEGTQVYGFLPTLAPQFGLTSTESVLWNIPDMEIPD